MIVLCDRMKRVLFGDICWHQVI